jgi:hypothetical protein
MDGSSVEFARGTEGRAGPRGQAFEQEARFVHKT